MLLLLTKHNMKYLICIVLICAFFTMISSYSVNECLGANEIYSSCSSPCVATCQNRQYAHCDTTCQQGCICEPGYLRDEISKQCVLPQDCFKQ
ncbi:unnamed protein product [Tenebrio molitor]|nr:unnamed protein product [Tenebrio molitor]